jgi:serine protease Do
VGNLPPGNRYDVYVIREGKEQSFDIRLAIREEDKEIAAQSKNLWPGMYIASLSEELREQLTIPEGLEGVLVTVVQEGSPAGEAGFRQGDVVQEVDGRKIRSAFDFYRALNNASGRETNTTVFRQNEEIELELETK